MRLLVLNWKVLAARMRIRAQRPVGVKKAKIKALTIELAKSTERDDDVGDEVLELNEGLSVDIDIICLNWLVHAETREDSTAPAEEAVDPSRDLRRRHVARKVLQLLDPGRKLVDVFVQPVGLETTGGLGPEAFEVDCIPLHAGGGPKVIEDVRSVCVCVFFYYTPSAQASAVPCLLQTVGHDVCLAHSKTLSKTSSEVPEGGREKGKGKRG